MSYRIDTPMDVLCYYTDPETEEESMAVIYYSMGIVRVTYPEGEIKQVLAPYDDDIMYSPGTGTTDGTSLFLGSLKMDLASGAISHPWDKWDNYGSWMVWNHANDRVYRNDGYSIVSSDTNGGGEQTHLDVGGYPSGTGGLAKDDDGTIWFHTWNDTSHTATERRIYNLHTDNSLAFDDYAFHDPTANTGEDNPPSHVLDYFSQQVTYLGKENGQHMYGGRAQGSTGDGAVYRREVSKTHEPGVGNTVNDPGVFDFFNQCEFLSLNGGRNWDERNRKKINVQGVGGARHQRTHKLNHRWTSHHNVIAKSHRIGKILGREQPGVASGETVFDDNVQAWVTHDAEGVPVYDGAGNRVTVGISAPDPIANDAVFGDATVTIADPIIVATGVASAEAFGEAVISGPNLAQTIEATGIPALDTWHPFLGAQHKVSHVVYIEATGIASGEAFGTLTVVKVINAIGIAGAEAFGDFIVSPQTITMTGLEAPFDTVLVAGSYGENPYSGVTSTTEETFGDAVVSQP